MAEFKKAPKIVAEKGIEYMMIPLNFGDIQSKDSETKQYKQLYCYCTKKGMYRLQLVSVTSTNQTTYQMPKTCVRKDKKTCYFDMYIPHDGTFLVKGMLMDPAHPTKWINLWQFRLTCLNTKINMFPPNYLNDFYSKPAHLYLPKIRQIPAKKKITFRLSIKNVIWPIITQKNHYTQVMYPSALDPNIYEAEFVPEPGKIVVQYCDTHEYTKYSILEFEACENLKG